MKYPTKKKTLLVREVNEDTYETMQDYVLDTLFLKSIYDEVHTIWRKLK